MDHEILTIKLKISNSFLIKGNKDFLLVDAGPPKSFDIFRSALAGLSIQPEEISSIFITHGHWDHWGSLKEVRELTHAESMINERERPWLENAENHIPGGIERWGRFLNRMMKLAPIGQQLQPTEIDRGLDDSDFSLADLGIAGRILHTPGHTEGSMTLLLDSGEAFVGDLAMSGFPRISGPGPFVVGDDLRTMRKSWRKLLEEGARLIYPSHGIPFSAEVFVKYLRTGRT